MKVRAPSKDGQYFAVGAIEPQFYAALLSTLGLDGEDLPHQMDRSRWREMKDRFAAIFRTKTRDEWTDIFDGVDACATPVLSPAEAYLHPQVAARGDYVEIEGRMQPSVAPRFGRTQGEAVAGHRSCDRARHPRFSRFLRRPWRLDRYQYRTDRRRGRPGREPRKRRDRVSARFAGRNAFNRRSRRRSGAG